MTNHRWELLFTHDGFTKYSGPAKPMLILLYIYLTMMVLGWIQTLICGEGKTIQDLPYLKDLLGNDTINIEEGLEPYVDSLTDQDLSWSIDETSYYQEY